MSRRRRKWNPVAWGLPEIELFEDERHLRTALREACHWSAITIALFTLVMVITGRVAVGLVQPALSSNGTIGLSPFWVRQIGFLLWMMIFAGIQMAITRRGLRRRLRAKLLELAVPVCIDCGYLLRGLPLAPGRCPECGRLFDDRVRYLVSNAPQRHADAGPTGP